MHEVIDAVGHAVHHHPKDGTAAADSTSRAAGETRNPLTIDSDDEELESPESPSAPTPQDKWSRRVASLDAES